MPKSRAKTELTLPMNIACFARMIFMFFVLLGMVCVFQMSRSAPAKAQDCTNCACVAIMGSIIRAEVQFQHAYTEWHITEEFIGHRNNFFVGYFFKEHLLLSLEMMAEQMTTVAMHQMMMLGALFDAKEQSETLRLFQQLSARVHKDYQPSTEMCGIGTAVRNLGNTQYNGEFVAAALSQRSQARQLSSGGTILGAAYDKAARARSFIRDYCHTLDMNGELELMCTGSPSSKNKNLDVDFPRVIDTFSSSLTPALEIGEDILALNVNLYGHDAFNPIESIVLENEDNHAKILDIRQLMAKRSVAENSFAALAALHTADPTISGSNQPYLKAILDQLDVDTNQAGAHNSYYGQMEVLTKLLYQRPQFYINLYDKPVNIERKAAAMRAISLMQNMDLFKSQLRSEAALAVLLETEIIKRQDSVQNRINQGQ